MNHTFTGRKSIWTTLFNGLEIEENKFSWDNYNKDLKDEKKHEQNLQCFLLIRKLPTNFYTTQCLKIFRIVSIFFSTERYNH